MGRKASREALWQKQHQVTEGLLRTWEGERGERRRLVPITNPNDQKTGSVMRRGPVGKESACSVNRALILLGWR